MMKQRVSRLAFKASALAAALALAACGVQPVPQPVEQPPPPPPPPSALLGGPETPPPLPPPAPAAEAPPPAPVIIAMAPIPNPPERPRAERRSRAERPAARPRPAPVRRHAEAAPATRAPAARPAPRPAAVAPAPRPAVKPAPAPKAAARPPAPALKLAPPPAKPVPPPQPKPAVKAAPPKLGPAPALKTPAPPVVPAPKAPAASVQGANTQAPASPLGERSARLAALESELADAVRKAGVLTLPSRFVANQPAEVTLTLPAAFSQTVRDAAAKNQLDDAVAAVNLTALLMGEGYVVTPAAAQSQPLVPGQPTTFQWTVNAMPGERGRLHADVGADLLGAGSESLAIGSVEGAQGGGLSPRLLGAGVLVLLALLVIAFLARNPQGRSRPAEVRRRQPVNLREEPR